MLDPGAPQGPLRSILYAIAQTFGCTSANLAVVDEDQQALVLAIAVTAPSAGDLEKVETALGFSVSGLAVPLGISTSALVRALREERLIITPDVREIAGGALPSEIMNSVAEIMGPRTLAIAPVLGRTRALGVLLVDRRGEAGWSAAERDLLITYAERVGAELESAALETTAQRLQELGQSATPPPALLSCAPDASGAVLICQVGPRSGQPLHQILGVAGPEQLFPVEIRQRLDTGEAVTLQLIAHSPGVAQGMLQAFPLRVTLRQIGSPSGRPLYAAAVEDLSFSQEVRREVALAQERLTKVMRSIGDAILTIDQRGQIQQVNEASTKVLGMTAEELRGDAAENLAATPRAREQLAQLGEQVRNTGFAEAELRLACKKNGVARATSFLAHVSALLLCDEMGAPAGAVWRIRDQTGHRRDEKERHQLRLRLLQSQRLSALGEMAARIAHEVRNPLVSIGAASQVIAEELPESSPVREEAVAIGAEVRRLDHILTNVLRFARPGRASGERSNVVSVLRDVIDGIRPKASGIELRIVVGDSTNEGAESEPPRRPLIAQLDSDQLKQVLWNLLLNACEAMKQSRPLSTAGRSEPPIIECSVRRRRQPGRGSQQTRRQVVLISIADSGPGIPAAIRRRVFDPFFSTKARGTGLGLSISKQIVEEAGGRIRLLNRTGGGTLALVELPGAG